MRTIQVAPYQPDWPAAFTNEAAALAEVFGKEALAIHHIGSTAVPGLAAKPVIDILLELKHIETADRRAAAMERLGYLVQGEFGLPGRRFFVKPSLDERTHHVHAWQTGSPEIDRHLAFRDYLRAHPLLVAEYTQIKSEAAQAHPHDAPAYSDHKAPWIAQHEPLALQWWTTPQIEPLTPARWSDLETLFGPRGACDNCWCMYYRLRARDYKAMPPAVRKAALKGLAETGHLPPGLIATLRGQPAGWISLAPREEYLRLESSKIAARVDDRPVWSVMCFFTGARFRKQGVSAALLRAGIEFARAHGAACLEAYPHDLPPREDQPAPFIFTGARSTFAAAGFVEVARRSPARPIMRLELIGESPVG